MIDPPPKYHRLTVGKEVRLMGAYIVKCEDYVLDENGNVKEVICTADLETGGVNPADGRKIKGTIHWVSSDHCIDAEIRNYDRLFNIKNPLELPEGKTFGDYLNTDSIKVFNNAKLEASLADATLNDISVRQGRLLHQRFKKHGPPCFQQHCEPQGFLETGSELNRQMTRIKKLQSHK